MAAALPFVAAAAAATSSLMATGQARQVGAAEARAKEVEAGVARTQAGLESEALAAQQRRQFGELRAAGAQAGLTESVTFGDVYRQAAAAAELDRSLVEYQGETQAQGLLTEARIARASRPSWAQGILQATGSALGAYGAAGGKLPSGGGSTKFTPKTSGPMAMTRRYTPSLPTGPRYG
jgi:hypothetical protein